MSDLTRYVRQQTAARGYVEGWTDNQFIARQLLLLIAEAAELAEHIDIAGLPLFELGQQKASFGLALKVLGSYADGIFKHKELWNKLDCFITDRQAARMEALDCAIVSMNIIAVLGGDDNDIRRKATNDVERGTRYQVRPRKDVFTK